MSEYLEEPKFEILHEYSHFEVRKYVNTIQAQVSSPDSEDVSSNIHFREIANYIFGNNDKSQNISMTAPVQTWSQNNETLMAFTMPSKLSLEELPEPNNNRVKLREIEGDIVDFYNQTLQRLDSGKALAGRGKKLPRESGYVGSVKEMKKTLEGIFKRS